MNKPIAYGTDSFSDPAPHLWPGVTPTIGIVAKLLQIYASDVGQGFSCNEVFCTSASILFAKWSFFCNSAICFCSSLTLCAGSAKVIIKAICSIKNLFIKVIYHAMKLVCTFSNLFVWELSKCCILGERRCI